MTENDNEFLSQIRPCLEGDTTQTKRAGAPNATDNILNGTFRLYLSYPKCCTIDIKFRHFETDYICCVHEYPSDIEPLYIRQTSF